MFSKCLHYYFHNTIIFSKSLTLFELKNGVFFDKYRFAELKFLKIQYKILHMFFLYLFKTIKNKLEFL